MLAKFRKESRKDYLKEVERYKRDQAKLDPTVDTFSDFLKRLKVIAKQAFQVEGANFIQSFLYGKLPINIQQDLMSNDKEDAALEETHFYTGGSNITNLPKL